jgi:hypothetical protein
MMPDIPFPPSSRYPRALVNAVACLVFLSACSINQIPTPAALTVTPTLTAVPVPVSSTPAPAALAPRSAVDPVKQAVLADWEEMFRTTQSYEYVKANGRPDDKTWWIEQAKRFYIGRARANYVEQINMMFRPDVPSAPGFLGNARYKAEVQSCSSETDCMVQVNLESGTYWAYDIRQKAWQAANPAEPITWTITMQYNPDSKHWMVK